jgi:hypothetical protein
MRLGAEPADPRGLPPRGRRGWRASPPTTEPARITSPEPTGGGVRVPVVQRAVHRRVEGDGLGAGGELPSPGLHRPTSPRYAPRSRPPAERRVESGRWSRTHLLLRLVRRPKSEAGLAGDRLRAAAPPRRRAAGPSRAAPSLAVTMHRSAPPAPAIAIFLRPSACQKPTAEPSRPLSRRRCRRAAGSLGAPRRGTAPRCPHLRPIGEQPAEVGQRVTERASSRELQPWRAFSKTSLRVQLVFVLVGEDMLIPDVGGPRRVGGRLTQNRVSRPATSGPDRRRARR